MKKVKKIILMVIVVIFLLTAVGIVFKSIVYTPEVRDASGEKLSESIAEIREIRLGGIEQAVLIRSYNRYNPVLLYLHGGPGTTEMIPFRLNQHNLEKYFTVVIWEQRGTGKSYSSNIPEDTMTVDQFISDAYELIEYLLNEFNKEKIVLAGHSWGSMLGMLLIHKYPDLFYAYAGSGQVVNPYKAERISYEYCLGKAEDDALEELLELDYPEAYLKIDPEGEWFGKIKTERKCLVKLGGEIYGQSDYSAFFNTDLFLAPEYSWFDFIKFAEGSVFSLKAMLPEIIEFDLKSIVKETSVPVFFLQGRHDYNTPSLLVEDFFNQLDAENKELIWFENSAHHPMYEEPEKYERIIVEKILPLCR
jgi:pimeloyl-ACP methyl ester carboxylesterase